MLIKDLNNKIRHTELSRRESREKLWTCQHHKHHSEKKTNGTGTKVTKLVNGTPWKKCSVRQWVVSIGENSNLQNGKWFSPSDKWTKIQNTQRTQATRHDKTNKQKEQKQIDCYLYNTYLRFFEKFNNIEKPLAHLTKKLVRLQINKIRDEKERVKQALRTFREL